MRDGRGQGFPGKRRAVRREHDLGAQLGDAAERVEVVVHVAVGEADQDRREAADQVARDQDAARAVEERQVAGSVAGRVDRGERHAAEVEDGAVGEGARGDRCGERRDPGERRFVSEDRHAERRGDRSCAGHVIAVVVRQDDRLDGRPGRRALRDHREQPVDLVAVAAPGIDDDEAAASRHPDVRAGGRRERSRSHGKHPDAADELDPGAGVLLAVDPSDRRGQVVDAGRLGAGHRAEDRQERRRHEAAARLPIEEHGARIGKLDGLELGRRGRDRGKRYVRGELRDKEAGTETNGEDRRRRALPRRAPRGDGHRQPRLLEELA